MSRVENDSGGAGRETGLERAIAARDRGAVAALVRGLVDVNAPCDPERETSVSPLFTVLRADAPELLGLVTRIPGFDLAASTPEWDAFTWARTCGVATVAAYLALAGVDVDRCDGNGVTLLHAVVQDPRLPAKVGAVLAVPGVRIDPRQADGATPLFRAALAGHAAAVSMLLDRGADAAAVQSGTGWTPLFAAVDSGDPEMVATLLRAPGSGAVTVDRTGATVLHLAATSGRVDVLRLLLERPGAPFNARDDQGLTPLLRAVAAGHGPVVELLLGEPGVDAALGDAAGITPIRWAHDTGAAEIEALLADRLGRA